MPYKDPEKEKEWQRNKYQKNKEEIRKKDRERYNSDKEYKKYK
jgi:hypothetical protein